MKTTYGKIEGTTIAEIFETLSQKNQDYIDEFDAFKRGSITDKRLGLIRNSLIKFADLLELDFDKANKTDITIAWNIIYDKEKCKLAVKSKQDDFMHIRQAFKHWFGDDEEMPKVVRGMKRPSQKGHLRLPKKLPTEADIEDMIKKCRNPRDKFWIAWTGLDSATRPCENRAMSWDCLSKDEHGYFFTIKTAKDSGDTENRSIRVIYSEPYLFEWMKAYPGKTKGENFVFCRFDNPSIPMNKDGVTSMFRRLKKRINFKGKFSAYTLRHATLTRLSLNPKVAIPLLKKMAGHTLKSNIIAEYQSFQSKDVLDMNLMASGKKDVEKNFEIKNKPIKCFKCNTSNPHDAEVCGKCNFALSQERMVSNIKLQEDMEELRESNKSFAYWIQIFTDRDSGRITQEEATQKMKALAKVTGTEL